MVDNSYKKVLDEAQLEVSQLTKKVIELDNAILKMSANLKKIDSKKLYSSETTQLIKEHRRELAKLNKTIDAQHRQIAKLSQKKKEVNALTGKEVANQRILKRNNNLQTQATSRLAGAYGRLVAQQKKLKTALKNSIIETGKSSAKSKQLQHALDKVTISVNKANRATSNFKNTGLGGMVRGFSNLLGAFGIAGGLMMIKDLTKNVFKLSKQFDSFGFAMKKIITDSIELGDTQEFLDRITQDYGVNLITTTERYIKFDAAARQSNLRMAETQNIFETVTKASGVLGLKTHELEGVYLALEQMLSKGKVTTEELRRQLGERLPGAFGIMANALGVSTVKLDKMLKKGEVLSKEALPKFAVELEKAFGLESVKTIDTLQAAQERLSNSWSMFVRDIAGQDTLIQGVFKGVLNFLSKTLESIGDIGDEIKEAFKTDLDKSLEADYGALEKLQKRQEAALNSIKNAHGRLNDASLQRFKIEDNLAKKFFENEKKILGVESAREEFSQKQASNIVEQISKYDDFFKLINDLGLRQDIYDQNAIAAAFARIKGIDKIIEETQNQIDAENELGDELDKNNKKRAKAVSIGKEYQKMLKDRESSVKAVDKEIKKHINTTIDVSDAIKDAKDVTEDAAESERKRLEGIEKMNKALKEMEGFFNEFKSEFLGNAGFEFLSEMFFELEDGVSKFEKLSEAAKESGDEFAFMFNTITEIGQEAFNFLQTSQDQYFDNQYARLEQQRDIAIQFAGESTSAQEEIERQYEARRKSIQKQQAKAQKDQALFNIGIDTAQAIVATLAQTPPPAGLPLAAVMAAIGVAQMTMVAATKVPEFFRGTENAPEGWALVDEKVPEVHTDRKGNVKSFGGEKANYRFLNAGDKIYKSHDDYLQNVLNFMPNDNMFSVSPVVNVEKGMSKDDFNRGIRSLEDTIKSKEGIVVNANKNGLEVFKTRQGHRRELMNNVLRLKGRNV